MLADQVEVDYKFKSNVELSCPSGSEFKVQKVEKDESSEEKTKLESVESKEGKVVLDGSKLTLMDVRVDDRNVKYVCVSDGGDIKREFKFKVAPKIFKPEKQSQTVTEGGRVEFKCTLLLGDDDESKKVTWTWKKNDTEIDSANSNYEIKSEKNSTVLVVKKVSKEDKGDYVCEVDNEIGQTSEVIQLRVKDALAALWPFLAIVAEVIILCVIILVYEKKCAKKPANHEEENEQAQSLTGNSDVKKRAGK